MIEDCTRTMKPGEKRMKEEGAVIETEIAEEKADTVIKTEKKDWNEIPGKAEDEEKRAMISLKEMNPTEKLPPTRKVQAELKREEKMKSERRQNYRCKKEWIF